MSSLKKDIGKVAEFSPTALRGISRAFLVKEIARHTRGATRAAQIAKAAKSSGLKNKAVSVAKQHRAEKSKLSKELKKR